MVRKNKCCIRNCPGLHKSRFSIPERSFEKWQEAVRMPLTKRSRICGVHFLKEDIHDIWTSGEGLNKLSVSNIINFNVKQKKKIISMVNINTCNKSNFVFLNVIDKSKETQIKRWSNSQITFRWLYWKHVGNCYSIYNRQW